MKFSEAMLKGFEMVGGKQTKGGGYCQGYFDSPTSVCVLGAGNLALHRNACSGIEEDAFVDAFALAWDVYPTTLNDGGMAWEHIYGMAVAAGL